MNNTNPSNIIQKVISGIFVLLICCILFAFHVQFLTSYIKDYPSVENRPLAQAPTLFTEMLMNDISRVGIANFASEFDLYVEDQFPLRGRLIQHTKLIKYLINSEFETNNVVEGGDGMYFYNVQEFIDYNQGNNLFSEEELEAVAQNFIDRNEQSEQNGAQYYIVLTPTKSDIYPENIPEEYGAHSEYNRYVQLLERLQKEPDLQVIDTIALLKERKEVESRPLFLNTDSHWNNIAAFYSAQLVLDTIQDDFLIPVSINEDEYVVESSDDVVGDFANITGLGVALKEENYYQYSEKDATRSFTYVHGSREINFDDEKRLVEFGQGTSEDGNYTTLLFHSSYTDAMKKFYNRTFEDTYYVKIPADYDQEAVEEFQPDIIIQEFTPTVTQDARFIGGGI